MHKTTLTLLAWITTSCTLVNSGAADNRCTVRQEPTSLQSPEGATENEPLAGSWLETMPIDVLLMGRETPLKIRLTIRIEGTPLEERWTSYLKALFHRLDKNGDSILSLREADSLLTEPGSGRFSINRNGMQAVTLPLDATPVLEHNAMDSAAFASIMQKANRPFIVIEGATDAARANAQLLRIIDRNADRLLADDELASLRSGLLAADANDNEILERAELVGTTSENAGRGATMQPPGILAVIPHGDIRSMAEEVLRRYDASPTDGRLSSGELRLGTQFGQFDQDGDQHLEPGELSALLESLAPAVEIAISYSTEGGQDEPLREELDAKSGWEARVQTILSQALEHAVNDNGDSVVLEVHPDRLRFNAAQSKAKRTPMLALERDVFEELDIDGDGRVAARESGQYRSQFPLIDHDRDGLATIDEFHQFMANRRLNSEIQIVAIVESSGPDIFGALDRDEDGRLSLREIYYAERHLRGLDIDGDASLSTAEIPRLHDVKFRFGTPVTGRRNVVAIRPAIQEPRDNPRAGPGWFHRMDKNGDGDVSRREFLGEAEEFQRIDSDNDELIDSDEAEKAKVDR